MQIKFLNDTTNARLINGMRVPMFPALRPNTSMVMAYKINIPSGFKTGGGGTLPGLMGGGDDCPQDTAGFSCWSVQLAWQPSGKGQVIAHIPRTQQPPVLQLPPTTLGDGQAVTVSGRDFDWNTDAWNWVKIRIQMNTPGVQDGVLRVEINRKEVVRVFGLVFRLTPDLGVDAALMEAAYSGAVPASPGGVAQYIQIRTVQMYNVHPAPVPSVMQALTSQDFATSVSRPVQHRRLLHGIPRSKPWVVTAVPDQSDVDVNVTTTGAGTPPQKSPSPSPSPKKKKKNKKKKKKQISPSPLPSPPQTLSSTVPSPPPSSPPPPPPPPSPPPPPPPSPPTPPGPPPSPSPPPLPQGQFQWVDLTLAQQTRAIQLTSIFENANTTLQYGYCENLGWGGGYTFGYAGFETAYDDALAVVQTYTLLQPNNALAQYIPQLAQLSKRNSGNVSTLGGFCDAVGASSADSLFRQAQDTIQRTWYFDPSQTWAKKVGLQFALSKAQMYDALVNHGEGAGDKFSIDYIVLGANQALGGSPLQGVDEVAWFRAFLTVRQKMLKARGDGTKRIQYYQELADAGNWQLGGPIYIDLEKRPNGIGWQIHSVYYGAFELYHTVPGHSTRVLR